MGDISKKIKTMFLSRVHDNFFNALEHLIGNSGQTLSILDQFNQLTVLIIVIDQTHHLGKVIAIPLTDTHGKRIDILVKLIDQSNC